MAAAHVEEDVMLGHLDRIFASFCLCIGYIQIGNKMLFSVYNGLNRKNSSIEFNNLAKQSAVCTALIYFNATFVNLIISVSLQFRNCFVTVFCGYTE